MNPPPTDPMALHARIFDAFLADLSDADRFRRDGFARTEALRATVTALGRDGQPVKQGEPV